MRPQINKTIAAEVAAKIVAETITKKRNACIEKLSEMAEDALLEHIGTETLGHALALPSGYVNFNDQHSFYQSNYDNIVLSFKRRIPRKDWNYHKEWDMLINKNFGKEIEEINKLSIKENKILAEVTEALIQLRWYDNIIKEFPEAQKHLPERNKPQTAITISFKNLRKEINSYAK